ncbi:MAG: DUF3341 domain-containing protein [Luteitalea sp.]|nr:DUF3341 domain-containing protein [Luteitalea sp.]
MPDDAAPHAATTAAALYGVVAEFETVDQLLAAARRVHTEGFRKIDAYTPAPVHGLAEAMGYNDRRLSLLTLLGGLAGCVAGFGLCYWTSVIDYPVNTGGRPLNSWPSFIVPTFETTILFAALSCFLGLILLCGFPQPYHPVFNVAAVRERATSNGLFLAIEAVDPRFDHTATRQLLESAGAKDVYDVEP